MNLVQKKVRIVILASVIGFGFGSIVHAESNTNKGANPKGKPFVEIEGQIVEVNNAINNLQDQIDNLVGVVGTIQDRVGANETAIATLESNNTAMQAMINTNTADIAGIQSAIADLEADIAANVGDIDANTALIENLQAAIVILQSDISLAEANLQDQIDNNLVLIGMLQDEVESINAQLALEQEVINNPCPSGSAITNIDPSGNITCEPLGTGTGALQTILVLSFADPNDYLPSATPQNIPIGGIGRVRANCPTGYRATGMGVGDAQGWEVTLHYATSDRGFARARNLNGFDTFFWGVLTCATVN